MVMGGGSQFLTLYLFPGGSGARQGCWVCSILGVTREGGWGAGPKSLLTGLQERPLTAMGASTLAGILTWTGRKSSKGLWADNFSSLFQLLNFKMIGKRKQACISRISLSGEDSFFCLFVFRAALAACRSSQTRGWTGATFAGLYHSHSNSGSQLCLQPIPQLMATPDL